MAIDEAILEQHVAGKTPPTLRLYGWNPAAVSVGYSQKLSAETALRIKRRGIDVVRRPTGGRAVLHANELTYSFIGSSTDSSTGSSTGSETGNPAGMGFLQPSIAGAYKEICAGLMNALAAVGVPTELGSADSSYKQMHDCFLATTTADLHFRGKKMVGSAQCRRGTGVLQHGSILLDQEQTVMQELLAPEGKGISVEPGMSRHANLFEAAGRQVSLDELSAAFRSGFEKAFDCKLVDGKLTEEELALAHGKIELLV